MPVKSKACLTRTGEKIAVYVPVEIAEAIRVEAARRRESLSELITARLRESLERFPDLPRAS